MSETEKYPALDYIVKTLKNAIADAKIDQPSANEYLIKDGNDEIILKQDGDQILVTDTRRIIYSEDLLETLQQIHMNREVRGNVALQTILEKITIIINGLDIETELVFQAVKDFLDQLSNSYEFLQVVESNVTKVGVGFKFGKHIFRLNIHNTLDEISLEPRFTPTFDAGVQKTIEADIQKVQAAINKMFKD